MPEVYADFIILPLVTISWTKNFMVQKFLK